MSFLALRQTAVALLISALTLLAATPGCSQQAEGERCTEDTDCDDGLVCIEAVRLLSGETSRCCQEGMAPVGDDRCILKTPVATGGTGGSGGSGGSGNSGGTDAAGANSSGGVGAGAGGAPESGGAAGSAGEPATSGGTGAGAGESSGGQAGADAGGAAGASAGQGGG